MIFLIAAISGFSLFAFNEIANPRRALLGKVLWQGNSRGVALTFDDGPHPGYTPRVLEILERFQARATFFVIGKYLEKYGRIIAEASNRGHVIGNHSYHHFRAMSLLPSREIRQEIMQCQEEAERWAGYRPRFYRQPAGFRNPRIFGILENLGMNLVGWQVRAYDTRVKDSQAIARRILGRIQPGGIILLHDGSDCEKNQDRTPTLDALPEILRGLRTRGLEMLTLDELFGVSREIE
jgi:peptidoglycan/xylan/chitin deacetylase (PgdA/CDA1 family)